jgi:hypothetical protein
VQAPPGTILEPSSALNQVDDQNDNSNNEQEMDQAAANMTDEAKKPEDDQDDNYSPEHRVFLSVRVKLSYVQPRSRKIKSKTGGMARTQSKRYATKR